MQDADNSPVSDAPAGNAPASAPGKGWIIALVPLCIALITLVGMYSRWEMGFKSPLFFISQAPGALILFGIFHVIFTRKQSSTVKSVCFSAIYVSLLIGVSIGSARLATNRRKAAEGMRSAVTNVLEDLQNEDGTTPESKPVIDTDPVAGGSMGRLERLIKEMLNEMLALRHAYMKELDAIGWNGILDGERLLKDTGLVESKKTVKKALEVVVKYREKNLAVFGQMRTKIENLDISASARRSALKGFEKTHDKSRRQVVSLWDYEKQIVETCGKIIDLLDSLDGAWGVEDGMLILEKDKDVQTLNALFQKINTLVADQEALQKEGMETVKSHYDRMAQ